MLKKTKQNKQTKKKKTKRKATIKVVIKRFTKDLTRSDFFVFMTSRLYFWDGNDTERFPLQREEMLLKNIA